MADLDGLRVDLGDLPVIDERAKVLQVPHPPPAHVERAPQMHRHFAEEAMIHLEFVRFKGQIAGFGLPIVRFTTENRLDDIIRCHEGQGCPIFNPHAFTLEEGGIKQVDPTQLAYRREPDPQGLLNRGKLLAWDNPDLPNLDRQSYCYKSLGA